MTRSTIARFFYIAAAMFLVSAFLLPLAGIVVSLAIPGTYAIAPSAVLAVAVGSVGGVLLAVAEHI